MEVYLPIAGIPVNALYIIAIGLAAGFFAGMFGIGGGFLITPFLIFLGINPAVAVATSTNQIVSSSVSGFMLHHKAKSVDFKMGLYMISGGLVGAIVSTKITAILRSLGQADLMISILYVIFLGAIGSIMGIESIRAVFKKKNAPPKPKKERNWQDNLPWKVDFPQSDMIVSGFLPLGLGFLSSIIVALLGIGGGFLIIPALIYIVRMPSSLVVGTSLFQMVIISIVTTIFHAYYSQTVDLILTVLLLTGSVFGIQYGTRASFKLPADKLRGLLAILILTLAVRMALTLFIPPLHQYSIISQ